MRVYRHPILPRKAPSLVAPEDLPIEPLEIEICETRFGEPLCACGAFILEWEDARRYGVSDATDGANA